MSTLYNGKTLNAEAEQNVRYSSLSELLGATDAKSRGAGTYWEAAGHKYTQGNDDAVNADFITGLGVKLFVSTSEPTIHEVSQYDDRENNTDDIAPVIQKILNKIHFQGSIGLIDGAHIIRFSPKRYNWFTATDEITVDGIIFDGNGAFINFGNNEFTAVTFGNNGTIVQNIGFKNFDLTSTFEKGEGTGMRVIALKHVAGYQISDLRLKNCPTNLIGAVAANGKITSRGYIYKIRGSVVNAAGVVIDLGASGGGIFAGLEIANLNIFPLGVKAPHEQYKEITSISQTNTVQIGVPDHRFVDGDTLFIRALINGPTFLNDREFTVTVVDANTVSLNGENGLNNPAYAGGGLCFETHGVVANCRAIRILGGTADTILGGDIVTNRFDRGLDIQSVTAGRSIGNIYLQNCFFDYTKNGIRIAAFGGNVNRIKIARFWINATDGTALTMVRTTGLFSNIHLSEVDILMSGNNGITLSQGVSNCSIKCRTFGIGRLQPISAGFSAVAGVDNINLEIDMQSGLSAYGEKGNHSPAIGVRFSGGSDAYTLQNCLARGTVGYSLQFFGAGTAERMVSKNRRIDDNGDYQIPEYVMQTPNVGAPAAGDTNWEYINVTGLDVEVCLNNGTSATYPITSMVPAQIFVNGRKVQTCFPNTFTLSPGDKLSATFAAGIPLFPRASYKN